MERSDLQGTHSKSGTPVLGNSYLSVRENETWVVRVLIIIFQDRPMISHIIQKISTRALHSCG